jgi:hypothetical protein
MVIARWNKIDGAGNRTGWGFFRVNGRSPVDTSLTGAARRGCEPENSRPVSR